MPAERHFAGTNVWFYAFVLGEWPDEIHKNAIARKLLNTLPDLSVQVVNELSFNLLRKATYPEPRLRNLVRALYRRYTIHPLTQVIMLQASELREKFAFSYWDSLIVATALENDSSILYSEEMQHGQVVDSRLTIRNPFLQDS
jgi:predicted nucleic acid-binding protein